jgi:hypothetical protein
MDFKARFCHTAAHMSNMSNAPICNMLGSRLVAGRSVVLKELPACLYDDPRAKDTSTSRLMLNGVVRRAEIKLEDCQQSLD